MVISGQAILSGTLDVAFIGAFSPSTGDRFEILTVDDGLSGTFDALTLPALTNDQMWQVRYANDAITLVVFFSGDFNADGKVDAADIVQWQGDFGLNGESDANADLDSDGREFLVWQRNFGRQVPQVLATNATIVPEPNTWLLALPGGLCWGFACRQY